jgi:peptide/nickel transport system permease protein
MTALTTNESNTLKKSPMAASAWRVFFKNRSAVFGLSVILIMILLSIVAPGISQFKPDDIDTSNTFSHPSLQHWMGTDNIGRDVWTRFLYGGRVSLQVGVIAMAISFTVGTLVGIVAGYYGGWIDSVLTWFTEVLMAFPGILLALVMVAILGPGLINVMIAVGIGSIPSFIRLARSSVMQLREMQFITAARALGSSDRFLLFHHILPNIASSLLVLAALGISGAIMDGASLSFLGLGVQPPTPEWGSMLSAGRGFLKQGWWISVFPGVGILFTILGINLIGDGLNDIINPQKTC